jgi:hypothetical protein
MKMNLTNLLGNQTVDSILSSFEAQREKLKILSDKLQEAAKREENEAAALKAAAEAKSVEAARALRVAHKISQLVS